MFERQILGEYHHDPVFLDFAERMQEYDDRCEEYDRSVCTREINGVAWPATTTQVVLIQENAAKVRREILAELSKKHELTAEQADYYWRETRKNWRNGAKRNGLGSRPRAVRHDS